MNDEEDSLESGSIEELYLLDYFIGIICDMKREGTITEQEANNMLDSLTGEKPSKQGDEDNA